MVEKTTSFLSCERLEKIITENNIPALLIAGNIFVPLKSPLLVFVLIIHIGKFTTSLYENYDVSSAYS